MRRSYRDIGQAVENELNIPYFDDLPVFEDVSDYVVVDGEEGEHGVIRFYHEINGEPNWYKLIAIYENRGGDDEIWFFTPYFKTKVKAFAIKYTENQVKMGLKEIPDQIWSRRDNVKVGDQVKVMVENWSKGTLTVPVIQADDEHFWVRLDSSTTRKYSHQTRLMLEHFKK